jgi:hypothetical protein
MYVYNLGAIGYYIELRCMVDYAIYVCISTLNDVQKRIELPNDTFVRVHFPH